MGFGPWIEDGIGCDLRMESDEPDTHVESATTAPSPKRHRPDSRGIFPAYIDNSFPATGELAVSTTTPNQALTNIQVVVLALYGLGGDDHPVDTEDVAVKANSIAPGRFAWRKYPEQISLEHVRVFLSDGKKAKYGSLVDGDGTRGWYLTAAGATWASANRGFLEGGLEERQRTDRDTKRRLQIERTRIVELQAWDKYQRGEPVSLREAEAVFRLSEYVRGKRRQLLLDRMQTLMRDDREFRLFVETMATQIENQEDRK